MLSFKNRMLIKFGSIGIVLKDNSSVIEDSYCVMFVEPLIVCYLFKSCLRQVL